MGLPKSPTVSGNGAKADDPAAVGLSISPEFVYPHVYVRDDYTPPKDTAYGVCDSLLIRFEMDLSPADVEKVKQFHFTFERADAEKAEAKP